MYAMQSISTLTPLRGAAASTVVRAGWTPLKYSLKTRLNTGKSSMLRRNTPTLTTLSMDVPPASSTARTLSSVTRVCSARSCETRSEEHTSELQSRRDLVCRLLLEKKKKKDKRLTPRQQKNHDSKKK